MTHPSDPKTLDLMRRQYGLITRQQALQAGLSSCTVARLIDRGVWLRVGDGLYRHAAVAPTWYARVLGACLRLGAYASHRSAAALWGLDGFGQGHAEVIVGPTQSSGSCGAVVRRSSQFYDVAPVVRLGIPTTPIDRTLLDLAGVAPWNRFEAATDDALRRELIDWPTILRVYSDLGRRGRNGSAATRRLLDERFGELNIPLSAWSRMFASILVNAGLPEPELEYVVRANGSRVAQVDLAYPTAKLAIELQSVKYHLNREAFERDAVRAAELAAVGWTWMPVTWERQTDAAHDAVSAIRAVLSREPQIGGVSTRR